MKPNNFRLVTLGLLILSSGSAMAGTSYLTAQNGATSGINPPPNWGDNSTWTPSTGHPNSALDSATLRAVTNPSAINVNGTYGVSSITLSPGGTSPWTLSGTGTLNLFGSYTDASSVPGNVVSCKINFVTANTFNIGATGGTTVSGIVSGASLVKTGAGILAMTAANTYTGGTTLTAGTLVAGNAGAFGTGSMAVNGGTLETGNGNTVITIGSTYAQASGGTLLLHVNNLGADQLNAGSTATLSGNLTLSNTVTVQPSGSPQTTKTFTLLTSTARTGVFTTVTETPLPANATETVTYTANDVLLTLNLAATTFTTSGLDSNEQAIVGPINSALVGGNLTAAGTTIDNALSTAFGTNSFARDLDQLSPEKFQVFTSQTAFNNASFGTQAMDSYLAGQRGVNGNFLAGNGGIDTSGLTINDPNYDPALSLVHSRLLAWNAAPLSSELMSDSVNPVLGGVDMKDSKDMKDVNLSYDDPWNFFVRGSVILAQGFSQADVPHFDDNTESVVLGTDYRISKNFLVGLTAGYAHTDATLDNNGSSATVDSYSPGLYASYADHGWYANLSGQYLHNAYTQDRNVAFLGQTAHSAPEGNQGVANLDGGYDFHHGALTFGPLAGLQYTHLSVDGFTESGSAADLTVNNNDSDSLRSRLGGTVRYAFNHRGMAITPHLDATWQHEFLDQSRGITSQFGFGGGSFAVRTPSPNRDSALVDAGVIADLNRTVSVFTDYIAQAGQDNYFGQSVQAGVKIGF